MKILFPSPPNDILPIPIAANAPIMIIHTGKFEGKLNASKTPVRMAEPSQIVGSFFIRNRWIKYSKTTQANTEVTVTINAPNPKK